MFMKVIVTLPVIFGLAGCLQNDAQRGVVGAAGGAVIAGAVGVDPLTGALIGATAGYFCDEMNIAGCKQR